jgi:tRNA G18 (ribose-2'-O)-methylase SpoU
MVQLNPEELERFWREQNPRRRALRERLDARRLPCGVAVENLTKDWNLGNLIRTANAFLCGELLLVGSDVFDEAGSGGIHRFERLRHLADAEALLAHVRRGGYTLIAVEIDHRAELLHRFRFPEKPLFLFGSELHGLSPEPAAAAERRLMIPQYGLIPCLNVNVSCSIVLYAYVTQCFPDLAPAPVDGAKYRLDPGSGQQGAAPK